MVDTQVRESVKENTSGVQTQGDALTRETQTVPGSQSRPETIVTPTNEAARGAVTDLSITQDAPNAGESARVATEALTNAINKGDKEAIARILSPLSSAEIAEIQRRYYDNNKRDISEDLKKKITDPVEYSRIEALLLKNDGANDATHLKTDLLRLGIIAKRQKDLGDGPVIIPGDNGYASNAIYAQREDMERQRQLVEKSIRETIGVLNADQIRDLQDEYQKRYGIDLRQVLTQSQDLSQPTKDALKILLEGNQPPDAQHPNGRSTENILKLAQIGMSSGNLAIFTEAFRSSGADTPEMQEARRQFRERYGADFEKAFKDTNLQIAKDYLETGHLKLSTIVENNLGAPGPLSIVLGGVNSNAIKFAIDNLDQSDRDKFAHGRYLALNSNLGDRPNDDQIMAAAGNDPLSAADIRFYLDTHNALKKAGNDREVDGYEDRIMHKGGGLISKLTEQESNGHIFGLFGAGHNIYDLTNVIDRMSEADWKLLKEDPNYRADVNRALDRFVTDPAERQKLATLLDAKTAPDVRTYADSQRITLTSLERTGSVQGALEGLRLQSDPPVTAILNMSPEEVIKYRDNTNGFREAVDKQVSTLITDPTEKLLAQRLLAQAAQGALPELGPVERVLRDSMVNFTMEGRNFSIERANKLDTILDIEKAYAADPTLKARIQNPQTDEDRALRAGFEKALQQVVDQDPPGFRADNLTMLRYQLLDKHAANDPTPEGHVPLEDKIFLANQMRGSSYTPITNLQYYRMIVDGASPEERQKLLNDKGYQDRIFGNAGAQFSNEERKLVQTALQQGRFDTEDQVRALVLGGVDFNQLRQALSTTGLQSDFLDQTRQKYREKYGSDLDQDLINKTSGDEQAIIRQVLQQKDGFRAEDTLRAFVLGKGNVSERDVQTILAAAPPAVREQIRNDYAHKYNSDLNADILNKVGSDKQIQYLDLLSTVPRDIRDDLHLLREERERHRSDIGDLLLRASGSFTPQQADGALDHITALVSEANARFEALDPAVRDAAVKEYQEALRLYRQDKQQYTDRLVNATVTLAVLASAPLTGGASFGAIATFGTAAGVYEVAARKALLGTDYPDDPHEMLKDFFSGFANVAIANLGAAQYAKILGAGQEAATAASSRIVASSLVNPEKEALLTATLQRVAQSEAVYGSGLTQQQVKELALQIAKNPGNADEVGQLSRIISESVTIESRNAGEKLLRAGARTFLEASAASFGAAGAEIATAPLDWDPNKSVSENLAALASRTGQAAQAGFVGALFFGGAIEGGKLAFEAGKFGFQRAGSYLGKLSVTRDGTFLDAGPEGARIRRSPGEGFIDIEPGQRVKLNPNDQVLPMDSELAYARRRDANSLAHSDAALVNLDRQTGEKLFPNLSQAQTEAFAKDLDTMATNWQSQKNALGANPTQAQSDALLAAQKKDIEALIQKYGSPPPIEVVFGNLNNHLGQYQNGRITISEDLVKGLSTGSRANLANTIAHEIQHAKEQSLIVSALADDLRIGTTASADDMNRLVSDYQTRLGRTFQGTEEADFRKFAGQVIANRNGQALRERPNLDEMFAALQSNRFADIAGGATETAYRNLYTSTDLATVKTRFGSDPDVVSKQADVERMLASGDSQYVPEVRARVDAALQNAATAKNAAEAKVYLDLAAAQLRHLDLNLPIGSLDAANGQKFLKLVNEFENTGNLQNLPAGKASELSRSTRQFLENYRPGDPIRDAALDDLVKGFTELRTNTNPQRGEGIVNLMGIRADKPEIPVAFATAVKPGTAPDAVLAYANLMRQYADTYRPGEFPVTEAPPGRGATGHEVEEYTSRQMLRTLRDNPSSIGDGNFLYVPGTAGSLADHLDIDGYLINAHTNEAIPIDLKKKFDIVRDDWQKQSPGLPFNEAYIDGFSQQTTARSINDYLARNGQRGNPPLPAPYRLDLTKFDLDVSNPNATNKPTLPGLGAPRLSDPEAVTRELEQFRQRLNPTDFPGQPFDLLRNKSIGFIDREARGLYSLQSGFQEISKLGDPRLVGYPDNFTVGTAGNRKYIEFNIPGSQDGFTTMRIYEDGTASGLYPQNGEMKEVALRNLDQEVAALAGNSPVAQQMVNSLAQLRNARSVFDSLPNSGTFDANSPEFNRLFGTPDAQGLRSGGQLEGAAALFQGSTYSFVVGQSARSSSYQKLESLLESDLRNLPANEHDAKLNERKAKLSQWLVTQRSSGTDQSTVRTDIAEPLLKARPDLLDNYTPAEFNQIIKNVRLMSNSEGGVAERFNKIEQLYNEIPSLRNASETDFLAIYNAKKSASAQDWSAFLQATQNATTADRVRFAQALQAVPTDAASSSRILEGVATNLSEADNDLDLGIGFYILEGSGGTQASRMREILTNNFPASSDIPAGTDTYSVILREMTSKVQSELPGATPALAQLIARRRVDAMVAQLGQ